jgi:hypothetical protein
MAFQIRMFPNSRQKSPPEDGLLTWLLTGLRSRGGGSLLVGAVIALAAFGVPADTGAQGGKEPPKAGARAEEMYGDQGGEKVLPADTRSPSTVMRARSEDTFFKLSNPRFGQAGKGKGAKALLIDYEVVSRGKFDGGALVLRADDGSKAEVALTSITGRDSGTLQIVGAQQFGNIKFTKNVDLPENLEMYVVRGDDRYDPPSKYMVSNSLVMGKMKTSTRPRNWTKEEIARYSRPPLAYKNPNAHADIGEDVPALPAAPGLAPFRYVDPDGRLLGLDYLVGDWENRKTLWRLAPVYRADQPKQHAGRSIARKGYAVAGAEVNADKYVFGIRLLFCRVKADGTFDKKDSYAGEWIGTPAEGKAPTLVNDGRRVLGIHFQQGAVVDRFALVAEDKAK